MAEGFFGGFAQGFSSAYGQGMQDKKLREQLGFEREKLEYQKTQDQKNFELQQQQLQQQKAYQSGTLNLSERQFSHSIEQDAALQKHQEYNDMLQAKQTEIQAENQKLAKVQAITGLFDPKLTVNQTKVKVRSFIISSGMDPKSEQAKQLELLALDPQVDPKTKEGWRAIVTRKLVNATPTEVDSVVEMVLHDPGQAISMMDSLTKQPELGTPVKVLGPDGKPQYEYGNVAASRGMTPAPTEPTVSIQNKTESTREQLFAQSEFERYNKEIRPAAQQASSDNRLIAGLQSVLDSGKFKTGAFAGSRRFLGQMLELGGVNPNDIPGAGDPMSAEVFDSLTKQMATTQAQGLSRVTNLGIGLVQANVPDLMKTPEGNQVLIDIRKKANDRAIQIQHKADEYMHKYKTLSPDGLPSIDDYITKLDNENPVIDKNLETKINSNAKKGAAITVDQAVNMWNKGLAEGEKVLGEVKDKGRTYLDRPQFGSVNEAQAARRSGKLKSGDVFLAPGSDGKLHQFQVP